MREEWKGFNEGAWTESINVADFIKRNYTFYDGDASFLCGPTKRTSSIMEKVNALLKEETEKGVVGIDTERETSILSYGPGYIDKDKEIIVGLQTDRKSVV